MKYVKANLKRPVPLGRMGENAATTIQFPINVFFPGFEVATYHLTHTRQGDTEPYPCATEVIDGNIEWVILRPDVARPGSGVLQLTAIANIDGEIIDKSVILTSHTAPSVGQEGEMPEVYKAWIDTLASYAARAEIGAAESEEQADRSEAFAEAAAASAEAAAAIAGNASGFADSAAEHATEAVDAAAASADSAEAAAGSAEAAAGSAEAAAEIAPFYAVYGVTTKEEIAAAVNNKRQIFVRFNNEATPVIPFFGTVNYVDYTGQGIGYRFLGTDGSLQHDVMLTSSWSHHYNNLNEPAQRAEAAADQALNRMNSADQSAERASRARIDASRYVNMAYAEAVTATIKAGEASDSATAADGSAKDAEAYAIGKRGGTDVGSTDPAYHNNAKYYAEQAASSASDAVTAFNTIADVANKASSLEDGAYVCTRGYYAPGDEGAASYKVTSVVDTEKPWQISIGEGKYLEISETERVTYRMFGAILDGVADDGTAIKNCHDYANQIRYLDANGKTYIYPCKVENHQGIIYKRNNVPIYAYTDVDLSGSTILMDDYDSAWFGFYVWGNNAVNTYSYELSSELISSMRKDNARLKFNENTALPPNTVVYFDEKPYSMRNNGEDYYTVERLELMAHKQDGWCATPFCDDWSDGADLFSVEIGDQATVNVYGVKQAWYNYIPSVHGAFVGCCVKYKCSNPNTTSAVLWVRRHNCTVSDFTFEPDLDQLRNSAYKNASIYVYGCYNVTLKNISGLNNAGKRLSNNTNATSGYVIRLFGCDTVNIERCDLSGFWGAIAASQVKSLTVRDTKSNRLDVHDGVYNFLIDNCTLYSHALQIGYGRGNLAVSNCKFYYSYQDDDCYQTPCMLALQATYGRIFSGRIFIRNCDAYFYTNPSEASHNCQIVRVAFDDTSQSLIEHYEYPELDIESIRVWSDDPEHTNLFYSYVLGSRTAKSGYAAPSLAVNELLDNTVVWDYVGRSYDFINEATIDTRSSLSTGYFVRCITTMSDGSGSITLGTDYFEVISGGAVGSSQPTKGEGTISWGGCQLQYVDQDSAEWKSNHDYAVGDACVVPHGIYVKGYCLSCKTAGRSNGYAPVHTSGTAEDIPGENLESITWEYVKTFGANECVMYSPGMSVSTGQYIEYNGGLIYVLSGGTLSNALIRFKWFEQVECGSAVLQYVGIRWSPRKWVPINGYCVNEGRLYRSVGGHDGTTSGTLLQNPSGRLIDGKLIWQALSEAPASYTAWSPRTEYSVGDCVQINENYYECLFNGRLMLPEYFYFGNIKTNAANQYGWVFDGGASVATAQKSGTITTKIQDSDLTSPMLNNSGSLKPFGKDDNPDIACYVRTPDEMAGIDKDTVRKYYAKVSLPYTKATSRTRIMLPFDTVAGVYRINTVCTVSEGAAIGISVSDNVTAKSIAANGHAYLKMPIGDPSASAGKQIIFAVYPGSANSGSIAITIERTNITDDVTDVDIDLS